MFTPLYLLALLFVIFQFVLYHWKRRRLYKIAAKIPGPTAYPFIGSSYLFISFEDIVGNAVKVFQRFGSTLKVWMFGVLVVAVTKPRHVQTVLSVCLEKDKRYDFAKVAFGNALLTAKASIWKVHRKIINPAFSQQILDSFMDIFVEQSEVLVEQLKKELDGRTFDVHEYLARCSLDIICETAMGITVEAQTKPSKFLMATRRAAQLLVERCVRIWLHPDIIFKYSGRGREFQEVLECAHKYTGKLVMKRYQEFHSMQEQPVFEETRKKPFLEHLLTLGDKMTFVELRNEVDLFITAGSDTITTTVGYALVCLGIYKDIQDKILEEINEIFGKTDRPITLDDLPKLHYMDRVLKETMRLYPPVPFVARSVTEDVNLGDLILPEGSTVLIAIIGTHRDPEIWPQPMEFNPDRFLPEEVSKRHPYSYIPFSGGPRNCIGMKFATMSMKVLLCTILRTYKIDTDIKPEQIKLSIEIVTKMIGGSNISISKR